MKKLFLVTLVLASAAIALNGQGARAASATASATQTVITAIAIERVSDLNFGKAAQGDPEKIILAGTSDNLENASFTVLGQANESYSITLPTMINMTTGSGGVNETIAVSNFTSYPAVTGTIQGDGKQSLFVGATRAALSNTQVAGTYTGTFTVTVVY